MTVVVVVGRGGPHRVADASCARDVGHIGEAHAAVVPKQAIRVGRRRFLEGWRWCAVREENVRPAIVVVVEDGEAAGRALDVVLLGRGRMLVDEVQPSGIRHVPEPHAQTVGLRLARGARESRRRLDRSAMGSARRCRMSDRIATNVTPRLPMRVQAFTM